MASPASTAAQPAGGPNIDVLASFVLFGATILALIFANSGLAPLYKAFLALPVSVEVGTFQLAGPMKTWIKDALMAVFFLLVGLEIKAEFKEGALSDRRTAILPFVAAAGGMAVPAIIYIAIVAGDAALLRGWAIPSATDIAFAVGVVGLLGARVPAGLKAFLLAVAVIDDLGAILIIAIFYTGQIALVPILLAGLCVASLAVANGLGRRELWIYLALGFLLWLCLMKSGVSATLAGVIAALFVPLKAPDGSGSPLHDLAHALKPAVLFFIMPVFAFANAGVALYGLGLSDLLMPVTLGVAAGLFIGKPIGITLFTWAAVRSGQGRLPEGATWLRVLGVAWIAGIGFTMSLFIGVLAFDSEALQNQVRLGVLVGSTLAALAGVAVLMAAGAVERATGATAGKPGT